MGLTIRYSFQLDTRSVAKARRLVAELRQRALNLPFVEVYEQIELSGEACNFGHYGLSDIRRWLAIQASRSILLPGRDDICYRVTPDQMIAFDLNVGAGCESADFGLCRYPGFVNVYDPDRKRKRRTRTKLSGWSWTASCKT
jgi:hypothetical protein